jgi:nitroreductase
MYRPAEGEGCPAGTVAVSAERNCLAGADTASTHPGVDHGIAAQSIMLGATEQGLGGCMIGSIDGPKLRAALEIPECCEILLVLSLGRPAETVVL